MAMAYGALANGGRLMEPRLVQELRDSNGRVTARFPSRMVRRVVALGVARAVSDVLVDVVEGGTGTRARLGTFRVAGKSGTTRAWEDGGYQTGDYYASFVGFFPAEDPQLVVMVKLDRPQGPYFGGSAAAPVTRATMEAVLAVRQTPIDRQALVQIARAGAPHATPGSEASSGEGDGGEASLVARFADLQLIEDPASAARQELDVSTWREFVLPMDRGAVRVPDVLGLPARAAARRIHEAGLRVEWDGSGVAKTMVPPPGSLLMPGDTVRLASVERSGDD